MTELPPLPPLPKWPDVKDYTFEWVWSDASGQQRIEPPHFDIGLFNNALASAALARLRVAVEALEFFERNKDTGHTMSCSAYWGSERDCHCGSAKARAALSSIGPLPEEP